jgi:YidC/Oxa1 family membrane protein insertase
MLLGLLFLLTGCFELDKPINAETKSGVWDSYFIYPLYWLLIYLSETFRNMGVANWYFGLAIVVLTIIIRIFLLPLMIKQTKSAKAMQAIQPEIKKLREKFSAKDQKTQQKLQKETMSLFQDRGVNPLAGCLPIFIQMPILLAFYQAIMRTHELHGYTFLWFALDAPDPFVLPIVAGITTFIQQKMMMVIDNPQMKILLYMMPIMIFVFAMFFPAALTLYWVVGNLFMIVQTYFITGPNVGKTAEEKSAGGNKK